MRHVRGTLFVDYVRMLRRLKHVDWTAHLPPEDLGYLAAQIEPDAWYPMSTFERFGEQILEHVAQGQLHTVRLWGRFTAGQLRVAHPSLLEPGDPMETLRRFQVMRQTFFDFDALEVAMLHVDEATLVIHYYMGDRAEEAASYQTVGFFEGLLELAGAREIEGELRERSWAGAPATQVALSWIEPNTN